MKQQNNLAHLVEVAVLDYVMVHALQDVVVVHHHVAEHVKELVEVDLDHLVVVVEYLVVMVVVLDVAEAALVLAPQRVMDVLVHVDLDVLHLVVVVLLIVAYLV